MLNTCRMSWDDDPVVKAWLATIDGHGCRTDARAALIHTLASAFMIQVRHNFMSNHILSHISRYRYIINPREVLVAQPMDALLTSQATKLRWVPITRDFSSNIDHREARAVMHAFYQGDVRHTRLARAVPTTRNRRSEDFCGRLLANGALPHAIVRAIRPAR